MKSRSIHRRTLPAALLAVLLLSVPVLAQDDAAAPGLSWPRDLVSDSGTITIYQPQVESFSHDILESRAAVALKLQGRDAPIYGAVWFTCHMSTDLDARTVDLVDLEVTAAKIPGIEPDQLTRLSGYLEREIPAWDLALSLDRLLAALAALEDAPAGEAGLNNDPPVIYFRTQPAVLVPVDGEPIMQDVENSRLKRVVNTPFFIVEDPSRNSLYLKGETFWYASGSVAGPWKPITNPPDDVLELAQRIEAEADANDPSGTPGADTTQPKLEEPPEVILSTVPAELIQTDGKPELASVEGTPLLYVANTESDILLEIETQMYFVLISGRWYRAPSLAEGPWTHVPPDRVPAEFRDIPEDSDMATVLASVAGTQQAREAVLATQVPQTAEVDRGKSITVEYDGDPQFEPIPGTGMQYAVNSPKSVLQIDGRYYCCDEAVWYTASGATGPWTVATSVPDEVQDIPPESPVYNTKYVYIYDTSTTVVYVGYTPGYTGAYYYGGCVVYGTGWWYQPWYHHYYYPRPVTWGFGVHYNPWTGWGFSFGVSYGWLHIGWGWGGYPGGYWGAAGYRHGYRRGYAHGYYYGRRAGYAAGYRAGQAQSRSRNMYRDQPRVRTSDARAPRTSDGTRPATGGGTAAGAGRSPSAARGTRTPAPSAQPNNVYTDRSGNTYRREGNEWQKRDNRNDTWFPSGGARPSGNTGRATTADRSQRDLNRQYEARQRGNQRAGNYNRSRAGASRIGGRGGGRRR